MLRQEVLEAIVASLQGSPAESVGDRWWGRLTLSLTIRDGRVVSTEVSAAETRQTLDSGKARP